VSTREGKPFGVSGEREAYYLNQRRSVVPYLVNLGNDTPEAIEKRIADSVRLTVWLGRFTEAEWRAMRADGQPRPR
jgi:hypothetical protein